MGGSDARGCGVVLRRASGVLARRLAPRSIAALEGVAELRQQVAELQHQLRETCGECAHLRRLTDAMADDLSEARAGLGRLDGRVGQVDVDVAEVRRLSLRVAQLSDLVFDRLAELPGRTASAN